MENKMEIMGKVIQIIVCPAVALEYQKDYLNPRVYGLTDEGELAVWDYDRHDWERP